MTKQTSNKPTAKAEKGSAIPDFEQSLGDLETLIEQMERGDLTLEESLAHFERGVTLTKTCQLALKEAQLKVDKLLSGGELEAFDRPADE